MNLTLALVTSAALIDSINPCAISVLLLTVGFLLSIRASFRRIWLIAGTYIIGIFLTYMFIGLGILGTLSFLGIPHFLTKFGALILLIFGILNLMESTIPHFPVKLAIPSFIKPRLSRLIYQATYPSFFLLGILVGLFEFPCTGGPYLMILSLLHDKASYFKGFLYLIYYNLIFVSPLLIILFLSSNPKITSSIEKWRHSNSKKTSIISSIITIILAIVILGL